MTSSANLRQILRNHASEDRAAITRKFFKTAPGTYGASDKFIGIRVPDLRRLVKPFYRLPLNECAVLLQDQVHEVRFAALLILIHQFAAGSPQDQAAIMQVYQQMARQNCINNWDLVDLSAPVIPGGFELVHPGILREFMAQNTLWEQRIAVVGSWTLIRRGQFDLTLKFVRQLLDSPHDLLHKACGWMLREIGLRDARTLTNFLTQYAAVMPRTQLRYAIEKFPEPQRLFWLKK